MLLNDKVAVIYGGGGAIGGAVARKFAAEGARVFLAGRTPATVEAVASDIVDAGGRATAHVLDAMDEAAVERHGLSVMEGAGRIDIAFNAVGCTLVQGAALSDLSLADFMAPIATWSTTQFLTSRMAGRHMSRQGSGVILTLSASPARLAVGLTGGFAPACSAIEALSRTLAAELGPRGVRVVCIRPHRIAETLGEGADLPMDPAEFRKLLEDMTLLKRMPSLDDVANTAAFLASDGAAAMSGTVANLSCGMSVD